MSVAVSSAPMAASLTADNRMLQRRDSRAADERAKQTTKLPYDENVGKLNKFYAQGNWWLNFTRCYWRDTPSEVASYEDDVVGLRLGGY